MRDEGDETHLGYRGGAAERRLDLAARERLLAALERLEPGLARVERELEALEAARLALLAGELCSGAAFDGHDERSDAIFGTPDRMDGFGGSRRGIPDGIPEEIFEETLLSGLTERAEDLITTCRDAMPDHRASGEEPA